MPKHVHQVQKKKEKKTLTIAISIGMAKMVRIASHANLATSVVVFPPQRNHPFVRGQCPAWGHHCNKCGGRNHFETKYKKSGKNLKNINPKDSPAEDYEEVDYIASIAENVSSCGTKRKSRHLALQGLMSRAQPIARNTQ